MQIAKGVGHLLKLMSITWILSLALMQSAAVHAQASGNPFEGGWTLQAEVSSLTFQSIKEKNGPISETSNFASFGTLSPISCRPTISACAS